MTLWAKVSRCRTGADPPRLGGAGRSCPQELCSEVLVGQLPPSPVPLNPGDPHLVSWLPKCVACGVCVWGVLLSLHFPSLFRGSLTRSPT